MTDFIPGNLIEHKLTKQHYRFVGKVTNSDLVVITTYDEHRPYTISYDGLHQYYDVVPEHRLVKGKRYEHSGANGTIFEVQEIFTNPNTKLKVAFTWAIYPSGHVYPTVIHENMWANYESI